MSSHRILLVTHVFPPAGGIAVQRVLSFSKYLPRHGMEVHVLTASTPGAPVMDPSLLRHVPAEVKVHKAFTPEPSFAVRELAWKILARGKKPKPVNNGGEAPKENQPGGFKSAATQMIRRWLTPDPEVVWVPFAIRKGAALIEKYKIDTVLITAPPFSALMTGNALKRRFPGIQLITDFRDEWLDFYLSTFAFHKSSKIREKAETIEREAVQSSSFVLSVTPSIIRKLTGRYPSEAREKFRYLPNGFDPEAFSNFRPANSPDGKVVVAHLGTVYKTSSAQYYLDALDGLPDSVRDAFETRYVGRVAASEEGYFEGRRCQLTLTGFLPQVEALKRIEDADYLMLTLADTEHATGKIFDYLATGKPILAITPADGEVAQILHETGRGWHADPNRPEEIRAMLMRAWECKMRGTPPIAPDEAAVQRYARPGQAARLAEWINNGDRKA